MTFAAAIWTSHANKDVRRGRRPKMRMPAARRAFLRVLTDEEVYRVD